jgi:phosphoesterase RecJ-like protein
MTPPHTDLSRIRDTLLQGHNFLLTSHARPDGDSLGSQLALAGALQQLGKQVRIINRDPAPAHYAFLAGVATIEIAAAVQDPFDAVVVLECSDLSRAGVTGLEGRVLINIDHHAGNVMYGDINWHDVSACACAEMVFELIEAIGARLTPALATHVYVAILTDTGSFRHAHITARTFEICRRLAQTGIDVAGVAAQVYNNSSVGRLRLIGMLLDRMQLEHDGRISVLALNDAMLAETGCESDDLEGIVNLPLAAQNVRVVIFIKEAADGLRVSLRSKNAIDIRQVAVSFGGGGHLNAAGFTIEHPTPETRGQVIAQVATAISNSDT